MDMNVVKSEKKICPCCLEEHVVKTVLVMNHTAFKNSPVNYEASYFFCDLAKEFYMDEQQMRDNDIKLKDAYKKEQLQYSGIKMKQGQINNISTKFMIMQTNVAHIEV